MPGQWRIGNNLNKTIMHFACTFCCYEAVATQSAVIPEWILGHSKAGCLFATFPKAWILLKVQNKTCLQQVLRNSET